MIEIVDYYYDLRQKADEVLVREYNTPIASKAWLKQAKIHPQPISFWNGGEIYFDDASLPPLCSSVTDLSNKFVLYGILCNGKFYIGKTTDFGERISSHAKDARNNTSSQQLYQDMARIQKCLVFVFCVAKTEGELNEMEHSLITMTKEYSIAKACGFNNERIQFIKESIQDTKEFAFKYCYNINN